VVTSSATGHVTVAGSFGLGNVGDEAVPLALRDLAAARGWNIELDVLARFDRVVVPGVVSLGPQDKSRRASLGGRPVVLCGGGILAPHADAVVFRCRHILQQVGLERVSLLGAGVEAGVQFGWVMRRRLRRLLQGFRCLYVRDEFSWQTLRAILPGRHIEICGDCVLWMKPAEQVPAAVGGVGRYLAVSLAPRWSTESSLASWLAGHLVKLAREVGAAIVFVPCSTRFDDDRGEHRKVAARVQQLDPEVRTLCVEDELDPRQVAAVLGASELTIAMRLHALVMAYAQRRPFVALAYHPKVAAFAQTVGCAHAVLPAALPPRQCRGAYGYGLAATGLMEADLAAAGVESLSHMRFEMLEDLRARLSAAFAQAISR